MATNLTPIMQQLDTMDADMLVELGDMIADELHYVDEHSDTADDLKREYMRVMYLCARSEKL